MMNERIKKIRKENNLTQEKFAERLGLKRQTIATYETGRSEPMDNIIFSICREFNINEDWLRTGTGDMHKEPTEKTADIVSELIEGDTPFNDIIKEIMNTYIHLDSKSKEALQVFSKELLNNLREKKED